MSHDESALTGASLTCPYVGARAFEEVDRDAFVGREQDVELVLNKVLAGRVTVLFGHSGVGKSSLLRAGLIPRMRDVCERGVFTVYHDAWVDGNYLREIENRVADYLRTRGESDGDGPPLLLVVLDGFEQLLARATTEEARELVMYLAKLAHADLDVRIAISLRAEFLARLDAYRNELPELMSGRFPLRPINREQVRRVLVEPARALGVEWEPGLVDRLIADFDANERSDDLGNTGPQLCFLSEVAKRLWRRMQLLGQTRVENHLYTGRDAELNGILADVFAPLDEPTLDAAARIVCRLAPPTGRKLPCTVSDLTSDSGVSEVAAESVLSRLQAYHLVRLRETHESRWFELTHDTLTGFLRRWGEQRISSMRERTASLRRRAERRARLRKLTIRGSAACLAVSVLCGVSWYLTAAGRVKHETLRRLQTLEGYRSEPDGAQRLAIQRRLVEQYALELWNKRHHEKTRWVLDWLEAAHERAPDAFAVASPERTRQLGEQMDCELLAGPGVNLRAIDIAWRAATPTLRRWHIPVTDRSPTCRVDYLDRGTLALSADTSSSRSQSSRALRSAGYRGRGSPGEQGAAGSVFEPVPLLQSVQPELIWDSVRVADYRTRFASPDLAPLLTRCNASRSDRNWPASDCALPRWTRLVLDLAMVKHEPMEMNYYGEQMTRVLLSEQRVIPHTSTFVRLLDALRPGSETKALECMAGALRRLSFEARQQDRVLPALLPLVGQLAEVCTHPEFTTPDARAVALWSRLDRDSTDTKSCVTTGLDLRGASQPDFERLGSMLQRLSIYPSVQVHLSSDLAVPNTQRDGETHRTPMHRGLIDDTGRLTPELAAELERTRRRIYERDGIVMPTVRFEKRVESFGRSAIEVVVQGACLSKASRTDLAGLSEDQRLHATVDAVESAVKGGVLSYVHRRDIDDALELVHPNVRLALSATQDDNLSLMSQLAATRYQRYQRNQRYQRHEQTRDLLRHPGALLSVSLLLRDLYPNRSNLSREGGELALVPTSKPRATTARKVGTALAALREGRVNDARNVVRALRGEADEARTAFAALYPEHVQRTLLVDAEQLCSQNAFEGRPALFPSQRSQAELAAWSLDPDASLLAGVAPTRIMRARLCVLLDQARRQTAYSPSAQERWNIALSALTGMTPEDARSGSLAAALELLRRSESAAPGRLPEAVSRAIVRLENEIDHVPGQTPIVTTLIEEPVARWRVELAIDWLRNAREFRWAERALAWMILAWSESATDARAVWKVLTQFQRVAPDERASLSFLLGRAHFRLDENDIALVLFDRARAVAPAWLRGAISDLTAETLVHAGRFNEVLRLAPGESESERCTLRRHQVKAAIATADPDDPTAGAKIRKLVEDEQCAALEPGEQAYARAWVSLAFGFDDADRIASELFDTGHPDADYVRLVLAGMRTLSNDKARADTLIQARWQEIQNSGAPANWAPRARQGDMRVWHETLIAFWAGEVDEHYLREIVASEENMARAGLAQLGLTLSSLRAEVYFYIGLRAATQGRREKAKESWRLVESQGRREYHEFAMARLLSKLADPHRGMNLLAMRSRPLIAETGASEAASP